MVVCKAKNYIHSFIHSFLLPCLLSLIFFLQKGWTPFLISVLLHHLPLEVLVMALYLVSKSWFNIIRLGIDQLANTSILPVFLGLLNVMNP